ncbi:MAG: hypothetical protein JNK76_11805 [Planctomycetales bacterium]|nr:hypothetical protein [Planctomycetales bacterium]MBN8624246.1 hypothetical protein [Planctomycetota bacterium]
MSESPQAKPLAVQAAKGSWMAPLLALGVSMFGSSLIKGPSARDVAGVVLLTVLGLCALGVVLGVAALCGVKKHGSRGIVVPAVIGLLLSGGFLYLNYAIFQDVGDRQRQRLEEQQEQRRREAPYEA